MLQITRRPGERIVLDGGIEIVVLEVAGGQVKVGIDAPRAVRVYRGEIWDAIAEENRAAADATTISCRVVCLYRFGAAFPVA